VTAFGGVPVIRRGRGADRALTAALGVLYSLSA
jgi:hypothetical protein